MKSNNLCSLAAIVACFLFFLAPGLHAADHHKKAAARGDAASLKGLRYGPAMPKGYEEIGGGFMSDGNHKLTSYGLKYVRRGKTEMFWLERVAGRDAKGHPSFEILDALVLPKRNGDEIVTWFACFFNGKRNDRIIAYTDKYFYRIHRTWLADMETGKITEVSPKGIVCQDPALGGL